MSSLAVAVHSNALNAGVYALQDVFFRGIKSRRTGENVECSQQESRRSLSQLHW